MLLSDISTLSAYPHEKIGVFLNNTIVPEVSSRMGIRFRAINYDGGDNMLNWNSLSAGQAGLMPDLVYSTTLSGYYNATLLKSYTQPTNFVSVPSDFPIFFDTSKIPHHDLLLNFRGGLSAITIFPSRPYPKITKLNNNSLSVSGGVLPLTGLNQNITSDVYYPQVNTSNLTNLESTGGVLSFNSGYSSAHKKNYLWKKVTTNALVGTIFNNDVIPATLPYDKFIIPQSFRINFALSATTLPAVFNYSMSYSNTIGNTHFLSGLTIEPYYSSSLSATVTPVNPIAKTAFIKNNADNTFGLTIVLDPIYRVPMNTNLTVYYDTSAYVASPTVSAGSLGVNNFTISSVNPIYFYNYQFDLPTESDAITISYAPSAILTQNSLSSVSMSTVMVDNFYQTSFPILVDSTKYQIKFSEAQNDTTLSAVDTLTNTAYILNTWFPASANIVFKNNGIANFHAVSFQMSGYNNSIYNYGSTSFILNKDKAKLSLSLTNSTDISASVFGNIFPQYDTTQNIKWTVYPPDNITLTDPYSMIPVPMETDTPANGLGVIVNNLGVDKTTITLYSSEYDISASTIWFPPTSIYTNVQLALSGAPINDFSPNNTSPFSALFVKNNKFYPAPEDSHITWTEILHDPNGSINFRANDESAILENTVYPSTKKYSNIQLSVAGKKVPENPTNVTFNINCKVFGNYYDLFKNYLFAIREYPSNANIYASITAANGQIIDTRYMSDTYLLSSMMVTAVALTSDFSYLPLSQIKWNLPNNNIVTGISAVFDMPVSYCLGISALSAVPLYGGFGPYDFSDSLCLYVYPNGIPPLDYKAFPQYKFFPTTQLNVGDNTYLNSVGMTGLSSCYSQSFIISTFGGFDTYIYKIGNVTKTSSSNIETLIVNTDNVITSNMVGVSAFNNSFPIGNPITIYNSASSDNSTVFKQPLVFKPFPTVTASISADNMEYDLQVNGSTYFDLNIGFDPSTVDIKSSTVGYVLSSSRHGYRYSAPFDITGNSNIFPYKFSLNPSDFFSITQNTAELFNLYLTGNIVKGIPDSDISLCGTTQSLTSNMLSLTAFDGNNPTMQIFTKTHLNPTNTTVVFDNTTPDTYINKFAYFVFDDGNSHIQTVSSYTDSLSGIYATEGYYSVALSGVYASGQVVNAIWNNFILIKDNFTDFDPNISRKFPDNLVLPENAKKSTINPNDWQFDSRINTAFENLRTNFYYLSDMTVTYDITEPKHFVGWAAEQNGQLSWRYNTDNPITQSYSKDITILKSFHITNDRIYLINGNKLEIRINDFNLTPIYSSSKITEGEVFQTPNELVYNDELNKLVVLDSANRFVYVFDVTNDTPVLTHYWGGFGSVDSRTKLNNPTDIYVDYNNNLHIVDSDSLVVKVYNKFLNWTHNITHNEWNVSNKPISISSDSDYYYVLSTNNSVYVYNNNTEFLTTFQLKASGKKIHANNSTKGFIYILGNGISVYTRIGVPINNFISPSDNADVIKINALGNEMYLLTPYSIVKVIDYINISSVKSDYYNLSAWDWSSIFIKKDEPVTTFVINDSFKKIHDNINLLYKDIKNKFVVQLDEYSTFVSQSISALLPTEQLLSASSFTPLGINEIVSYDTIHNMFTHVYDDLTTLKNVLNVRYVRESGQDICWSWKSQRITKPHSIVNFNKPFSWYELRQEMIVNNPYLSGGSSWNDLRGCCGDANSIPITWSWDQLTCCDNPSITWDTSTCNRIYSTTWNQLNSVCQILPNKYFEDCVTVC